jgi:hypothetical protein
MEKALCGIGAAFVTSWQRARNHRLICGLQKLGFYLIWWLWMMNRERPLFAHMIRGPESLMKKNWYGAQYVSTYEQFKKHFHCSPVHFVSARNCFCILQPSALMYVLLVNWDRNFMPCYSLKRVLYTQKADSIQI